MTEQPPPHSARLANYLLGGAVWGPAEAHMGDQVIREFPGVVTALREGRAFLGRAVSFLVKEAGMRQFIDLGAGLPAPGGVDEVARRHAPGCRVVQADHDPLVPRHAAEGTALCVEADFRDIETVLGHAAAALDPREPVALVLVCALGHVPDPDEAAALVQGYMSLLAPGSYLVTADGVTSAETLAAQQAYNGSGAHPYLVRTPEQIAATAAGLDVLPPGVGPVSHWRPDAVLPDPVDLYGLVARKPVGA
ncbi:SAM-dependent methyltransferase [Streptomyces sp. PT12]|uniref:SAM-dependent methyltransferase n=1 Tax=Streptomyces sp. PT12 TaxID=1510197 RepID=UPI000DE4929F|nr:SAM-dependent methyltransferase [Streptomyces sp. PT12]RBM18951.1 hypothetical protein DEH69_10980 [Streptomyces sp. PT12]